MDSNKVYATADNGALTSDDGGATWQWRAGGAHFDLSIDPSNPDIVWTTYWDGTGQTWPTFTNDGGVTWFVSGSPVTQTSRGAIAISPSDPDVIYATYSGNEPADYAFRGAYKSTDGGATWNLMLAPEGNNYMGGQGWYNNVVAVSPIDANLVHLAGVEMQKSTDGGSTWANVDSGSGNGLHPDYHASPGSSRPVRVERREGGS
ncbi:MAG: hypothetical protein R3E97_24530 [Candidatus Eisenbacteria bacterium]